MNFKTKPTPPRQEPSLIDLDKYARDLDEGTRAVNASTQDYLKYAPPAVRNQQQAVNQVPFDVKANNIVASFGELPLKEIDTMLEGARAEMASLENEATQSKQIIKDRIDILQAGLERFHKGIKLTIDKLQSIREEVKKLDEPQVQKEQGE